MERLEVWARWQAGDSNRLIGRDLGRSAASIRAFVESWGGVRPKRGDGRLDTCRLMSVRRFHGGWQQVTRCGWWQPGWVVPLQPSRGSWLVTEAVLGIGLIMLIGRHGVELAAQTIQNWPKTLSCVCC